MDKRKLAMANAMSADIENYENAIAEMRKDCASQFPPKVDADQDPPRRDILITIGQKSFTANPLYVKDEQLAIITNNAYDSILRAMKKNKEDLEKEFRKF